MSGRFLGSVARCNAIMLAVLAGAQLLTLSPSRAQDVPSPPPPSPALSGSSNALTPTIAGTYNIAPAAAPDRYVSRMIVHLREGNRITVTAADGTWVGEGLTSGNSGYYTWKFVTGVSRVGRTDFTVRADGTWDGHSVGTGVDSYFIARLQEPPVAAVSSSAPAQISNDRTTAGAGSKAESLPDASSRGGPIARVAGDTSEAASSQCKLLTADEASEAIGNPVSSGRGTGTFCSFRVRASRVGYPLSPDVPLYIIIRLGSRAAGFAAGLAQQTSQSPQARSVDLGSGTQTLWLGSTFRITRGDTVALVEFGGVPYRAEPSPTSLKLGKVIASRMANGAEPSSTKSRQTQAPPTIQADVPRLSHWRCHVYFDSDDSAAGMNPTALFDVDLAGGWFVPGAPGEVWHEKPGGPEDVWDLTVDTTKLVVTEVRHKTHTVFKWQDGVTGKVLQSAGNITAHQSDEMSFMAELDLNVAQHVSVRDGVLRFSASKRNVADILDLHGGTYSILGENGARITGDKTACRRQ